MRSLKLCFVSFLLVAPGLLMVQTGASQDSVQQSRAISDAGVLVLLGQAYAANLAGDDKLATSLLDEVKAINPEQPTLWRQYASIAHKRSRFDDVIADMKVEAKVNSRDLTVYPYLADTQEFYGHETDVPETLRAWMLADPDNVVSATRLVATLTRLGQPAEAIAAAKRAFTTLPEEARQNPRLLTAYAGAEYKSGQMEAGTATLTGVIKGNTDPAVLNAAAYELADYGQSLRFAETTERAVLAQLATETAAWTGSEVPKTLAAKSSTLYASWDTMGWVLFREGNFKEAQRYLEAAYSSRPNVEIGSHLGDDRAALGDLNGARKAYLLSSFQGTRSAGYVETAFSKARRLKIEAKADAIKQEGPPVKPLVDFAEMQTVPLGAAAGRSGIAEYRVLLSVKGVESVEPAGTATVSGGADLIRTMKTARFFPDDSAARMMKQGLLNCHGENCELIFEP